MCELLVFTTNTVGDDVYRDAKLPKRGDVISIQEDGWQWGVDELHDSRFLVVKIPGTEISEVSALLSPEVDATMSKDPAFLNQSLLINTLQYRGFNLNLDAMQLTVPIVPIIKTIEGVQRLVAPMPVDMSSASMLLAYKVKKAPITNPAIIGTPTNIIG